MNNPYDFYITPVEYEIAARNGVDAESMNRRVRLLGWEKEKAIRTPLRRLRSRKKWAKIAENNGICYGTFMSRVCHYGWDEERAATQPLQDRKAAAAKATEKIRFIPRDLIELASKNGISYHTLHARIVKYGWDLEKAASIPPRTHKELGKIGVRRVRGKYGDRNRAVFEKTTKGLACEMSATRSKEESR